MPSRTPLVRSALLTAAVASATALGGGALAGPVDTVGTAAAPVAATAASDPAGTRATLPKRAGAVRHVVAISVDGLNPRAVRTLGPKELPTLYRMIRHGASTLNARTAYERTRTLPNHTGMLTGRRVDASKGGHGVWFNSDDAGTTVHAAAGEYVESVFDVVHDHGGSTALFTGKDKFDLYDRTWNGTHGAPDTVGEDDGRDKIDRFFYSDDASAAAAVRAELTSGPRDLTFLHLAGPDKEGHATGYLQAGYLAAVDRADQHVRAVVRTIRRDPYLAANTVVVLTSDHGGKGYTHEDESKRYNYTVPFMVWGAGVDAGDLYAMNPDYANPGTGRPGYDVARPPVRNADAANVVTGLLGLPAVAGSTINPGHELDLTTP